MGKTYIVPFWRFYLFDARWKANPDLLESLVVISEAKSNKSWWLLFTLPIAMIIIQLKKVFLGSWFWPDCSIVASTKDKLDFVFSLLLALATLLYCSDSTFAFCTNNQLRILRILLLDYFDYSSNMFQGRICGLQQKDLVSCT